MGRPSDREIRRAYEECDGVIVRMASHMGRPLNTVKHWCLGLGLKGKGRGGNATQAPPRAELEALHVQFAGNLQAIADAIGASRTAVHSWMRKIGLAGMGREKTYGRTYPREVQISVPDGYVIAFSDAHFWTEEKSRAHVALLSLLKKLKPKVVIANGDVLDAASISRHDPSGLDEQPKFKDELYACQTHMAEIRRLSGGAQTILCLGNHDARFSRYVARNSPELLEIDGGRLDHHILGWKFCWSVRINNNLLVMHRFRGGQHATYTNTIRSGISIATGHLHSQRVYPFSDANGTRWGIDLGCLAEIHGPQFAYTEANPMEWRSGFAVFEFRDGRLLPPQLVTVLDDGAVCWQRNEIVS